MSSVSSFQTNITAEPYLRGILEIMLFSSPITLSCFVFLFINGIMMFSLRSRPVFCQTSRYILLFNLLFADTAQLLISQILYLIHACRFMLTYPLCGVFIMTTTIVNEVSPLTLVVMSLERYVAVCYPLRHGAIVTSRNTGVAIVAVWAFCLLNILIRVLLLLQFPFNELESLQMQTLCTPLVMFLVPGADLYDKAYTCVLFTSTGLAVISSYIGVMVAARSASTNKESAHKARNTLLLHLVQLVLSLSSTIFNPLVFAISKVLDRAVFVRLQNILYVFISLLPRCLSSLIYGIRDQTIKPVLLSHLCCLLKPPKMH